MHLFHMRHEFSKFRCIHKHSRTDISTSSLMWTHRPLIVTNRFPHFYWSDICQLYGGPTGAVIVIDVRWTIWNYLNRFLTSWILIKPLLYTTLNGRWGSLGGGNISPIKANTQRTKIPGFLLTAHQHFRCMVADWRIDPCTMFRVVFLWRFDPIPGHGLPLRGFAIIITGHTTLGRSSLDEWSSSSQRPATLTRDRHPCLRRDSNPQSQQARGRRTTPLTARPLGPAYVSCYPFWNATFCGKWNTWLTQLYRRVNLTYWTRLLLRREYVAVFIVCIDRVSAWGWCCTEENGDDKFWQNLDEWTGSRGKEMYEIWRAVLIVNLGIDGWVMIWSASWGGEVHLCSSG